MIGRMSRFVLLVALLALAVPQAVFAVQEATPVTSDETATDEPTPPSDMVTGSDAIPESIGAQITCDESFPSNGVLHGLASYGAGSPFTGTVSLFMRSPSDPMFAIDPNYRGVFVASETVHREVGEHLAYFDFVVTPQAEFFTAWVMYFSRPSFSDVYASATCLNDYTPTTVTPSPTVTAVTSSLSMSFTISWGSDFLPEGVRVCLDDNCIPLLGSVDSTEGAVRGLMAAQTPTSATVTFNNVSPGWHNLSILGPDDQLILLQEVEATEEVQEQPPIPVILPGGAEPSSTIEPSLTPTAPSSTSTPTATAEPTWAPPTPGGIPFTPPAVDLDVSCDLSGSGTIESETAYYYSVIGYTIADLPITVVPSTLVDAGAGPVTISLSASQGIAYYTVQYNTTDPWDSGKAGQAGPFRPFGCTPTPMPTIEGFTPPTGTLEIACNAAIPGDTFIHSGNVFSDGAYYYAVTGTKADGSTVPITTDDGYRMIYVAAGAGPQPLESGSLTGVVSYTIWYGPPSLEGIPTGSIGPFNSPDCSPTPTTEPTITQTPTQEPTASFSNVTVSCSGDVGFTWLLSQPTSVTIRLYNEWMTIIGSETLTLSGSGSDTYAITFTGSPASVVASVMVTGDYPSETYSDQVLCSTPTPTATLSTATATATVPTATLTAEDETSTPTSTPTNTVSTATSTATAEVTASTTATLTSSATATSAEAPSPTFTATAGVQTGSLMVTIQTSDGSDLPDGLSVCVEDDCQSIAPVGFSGATRGLRAAVVPSGVEVTFTDLTLGEHEVTLRDSGHQVLASQNVMIEAETTTQALLILQVETTPTATTRATVTVTSRASTQTPTTATSSATETSTSTVVTASLPNTGAGGGNSSAAIAVLLAVLALILTGAALAVRRR